MATPKPTRAKGVSAKQYAENKKRSYSALRNRAYTINSRGKVIFLPKAEVSATPKALKTLEDLSKGKGGKESQKEARKAVRQIRYIKETTGSFNRYTPRQAKIINKQISKALEAQENQIYSKNGLWYVPGAGSRTLFTSQRAAEAYLESQKQTEENNQSNQNITEIPDRSTFYKRSSRILDLAEQRLLSKKEKLSSTKVNATLEPYNKLNVFELAKSKFTVYKSNRDKIFFKDVPKIAKYLTGSVLIGLSRVGLDVIGLGIGTAKAAKKPKETYQKTKAFIKEAKLKNLPKTVRKVANIELQRALRNPVSYATELYAFNKFFDTGSSLAKESKLGKTIEREIFLLKQPKELRKNVRAVLKGIEAQRGLKPFNVNSVGKLTVKGLTKTETNAALRAIKNTKSILFGSAASRILSKGKTKIPKDLDIGTSNIKKFYKEFIKTIPKSQKGLYTLKGEKVLKRGVALFDIKPISRLKPGAFLGRFGKGKLPITGFSNTIKFEKYLPRLRKKLFESQITISTEPIKKVSGIKLTSFSEQTTRKGLGTLQVLLEKNIKRAKDPQAFVELLQIQATALKKLKTLNPIKKALYSRRLKKIEQVLKILRSKQFIKQLSKKSKGITDDFPILKKINVKKLKKTKLLPKKEAEKKATRLINSGKDKDFKITKKIKKQLSKLPKTTESKIPSSLTPYFKKSKVPVLTSSSLIPFTSKLKSKVPKSKTPKRIKSKTPKLTSSKIKKLTPSKIKAIISKIPKSKIPSSKLVRSIVSNVPKSKIPKSVLPKLKKILIKQKTKKKKTKEKREDNNKQKEKEYIKKVLKNQRFIYLPDLAANLLGQKAKGSKRKQLLVKKIFTGLERRLII